MQQFQRSVVSATGYLVSVMQARALIFWLLHTIAVVY